MGRCSWPRDGVGIADHVVPSIGNEQVVIGIHAEALRVVELRPTDRPAIAAVPSLSLSDGRPNRTAGWPRLGKVHFKAADHVIVRIRQVEFAGAITEGQPSDAAENGIGGESAVAVVSRLRAARDGEDPTARDLIARSNNHADPGATVGEIEIAGPVESQRCWIDQSRASGRHVVAAVAVRAVAGVGNDVAVVGEDPADAFVA